MTKVFTSADLEGSRALIRLSNVHFQMVTIDKVMVSGDSLEINSNTICVLSSTDNSFETYRLPLSSFLVLGPSELKASDIDSNGLSSVLKSYTQRASMAGFVSTKNIRELTESSDSETIALVKYGLDHLYTFGKISGFHLLRNEAIVRYMNGTLRNLQYHELIVEKKRIEQLNLLPIVFVPKVAERTTTFLFISQWVELVLYVLLILFGARSAADSNPDDGFTMVLQFACHILGTLATIRCIHLFNNIVVAGHSTLYWILSYKVASIVMLDYFSFQLPNLLRGLLTAAGLIIRFVDIYLILRHPQFVNYSVEMEEEIRSHFYTEYQEKFERKDYFISSQPPPQSLPITSTNAVSVPQATSKSAMRLAELLSSANIDQDYKGGESNDFYAPASVENKISLRKFNDEVSHEKNFTRNKFFLFFGIVFLFFLLPIILIDSFRLISRQNPLFSDEELKNLLNEVNTSAIMNSTVNTNTTVLVLLLDGLRYDSVSLDTAFHSLLETPSFKKDSVLFEMNVQIPSMSVPNWLTLMSGAPPLVTGLLGNLNVGETKFPTIFSNSRSHNKTTGLTGSSWFSQLLREPGHFTLGRVSPDATADSLVNTYTYMAPLFSTEGLEDDFRRGMLETLFKDSSPINGKSFDFYLAHFSDIDEQGHLYGVSQKYNKLNSYDQAVTRSVSVIKNIAESLDENTIFLILSDHGQVDAGGHGGLAPDLLSVPFITFKKNSNLSDIQQNPPVKIASVDIAPTISAFMGLPPPAASFGNIITNLFEKLFPSTLITTPVYAQHDEQRRIFTSHLANRLSVNAESINGTLSTILDLIYQTEVSSAFLSSNFKGFYKDTYNSFLALNTFLSICWYIMCFALITVYVYHTTPLRTFRTCFVPTSIIFFWSLFSIVGYYALIWIFFYSYWYGYGYTYNTVESTLLHHPRMIPMVIATILIPGIAFEIFWIRVVHVISEKRLWDSNWAKLVNVMSKTTALDGKQLNIPKRLNIWQMLFAAFRILFFAYNPTKHNPVLNYIKSNQFQEMAAGRSPAETMALRVEEYQNGKTMGKYKFILSQSIYYHHEEFLSLIYVYQIEMYSFLFLIIFMFTLLITMSSYSNLILFLPRFYPMITKGAWSFRFITLLMLWMSLPSFVGKIGSVVSSLGRLRYIPMYLKTADLEPRQQIVAAECDNESV